MFRKRILSYGAVALAAAVLILATPPAARAIAATLVQVTNTSVNPAVAQSPDTQAAQLVRLTADYLSPGATQSLQANPLSSHFSGQAYTVPGQPKSGDHRGRHHANLRVDDNGGTFWGI